MDGRAPLPRPSQVAAREHRILGAVVIEADLWNVPSPLPPRALWHRATDQGWAVDLDGRLWPTPKSYFKSLLKPPEITSWWSPSYLPCSIQQTAQVSWGERNTSPGMHPCTQSTSGKACHSSGHPAARRLHLETWL
uniref:Accessory movement protein n=1 Tax=Maize mild mottle virus TaxID=2931827 RepID=A0A8T9JDC5_9VIRU|nr:accessory movement protein [Maize mild mottle virus]